MHGLEGGGGGFRLIGCDGAVDGEFSAAGDQEGEGGREEHEREFHAAVAGEKRAAVDEENSDGHGDGVESSTDAGEKSEGHHEAAEEFAGGGVEGPENSGVETEAFLEKTGGGGEAVSAEPAEKFLRTVSGENDSGGDPDGEKSDGVAGGDQSGDELVFHDVN